MNIRHSSKEIGTKEYFEEVAKRKYLVEPHIIDFANFENYKNKKVLEVGCGIGTAAQSFVENGAIYTGIDLTETAKISGREAVGDRENSGERSSKEFAIEIAKKKDSKYLIYKEIYFLQI